MNVEKNTADGSTPWLTDEMRDVARNLLEGNRKGFQQKQRRRAVPRGSAPTEAWTILLDPNYKLNLTKTGLGNDKQKRINNQLFFTHFLALVQQIIGNQVPPLGLSRSMDIPLDKATQKHVFHGFRVIHLLDPVGKQFYANAVEDVNAHAHNDDDGYQNGRSREEAIVVQNVGRERVAALERPFITICFDIANAFGSQSFVCLDDGVRLPCPPLLQRLGNSRYRRCWFTLATPGVAISMRPGQGGLQGDPFTFSLFRVSYNAALGKFWSLAFDRAVRTKTLSGFEKCLAYAPSGYRCSLALTRYADDVAKKEPVQHIHEDIADKIANVSDDFTEALAPDDLAQNTVNK